MRRLLLLCLWCAAWSAQAELDIEITGAGEHQTPMSVVRFAGEAQAGQDITGVVANDLMRTGLFKLIDPAGRAPHEPSEVKYADWPGVEALLMGSVLPQDGGNVVVRFRLVDMVRRTELISQTLMARSDQMRAIAHRIADMAYERLTGSPGVFSTRIAYVNRDKKNYRLVVADSDGYGEQTLLASPEPIMSPAWSPDGKQIAYVSFEQQRAMVYVQSLSTRQRQLLASFPGSNSSPAWSPDGKFLLFTSDRGGSAQIYRVALDGGEAERLTYEGSSNFSPRFSPDGKGFVFAHFNGGKFYIATQDFETKQMQILTAGGWDKKPSFAPNGKLVLFGAESQGRGILATVSSDGKVKQKMVAQYGDIREPTWGPFLKQ